MCSTGNGGDSTNIWWARAIYTIEGDMEGITHPDIMPTFVEASCKCSAESALRSIFEKRKFDRPVTSLRIVSGHLVQRGVYRGYQQGPALVQISPLPKAS